MSHAVLKLKTIKSNRERHNRLTDLEVSDRLQSALRVPVIALRFCNFQNVLLVVLSDDGSLRSSNWNSYAINVVLGVGLMIGQNAELGFMEFKKA